MGSNWDKIFISIPTNNENRNISGDGWTLKLNDGYSVTKDRSTGNYKLTKE